MANLLTESADIEGILDFHKLNEIGNIDIRDFTM